MSETNATNSGTPVPTTALWTWTAPVLDQPAQVVSFPTIKGAPTKTGLLPADLKNYMQVPIVNFGPPPVPVDDATITEWIRYAEDEVESITNVRLCQTWVAAPAAKTIAQRQALNLGTQNNFQQPGIDFDYEEAGYDFFADRWRDSGWGYVRLRCRPVKSVSYYDPTAIESTNTTGMKNVAFIYPLLNEFFRMPNTWIVEDQNRGLVRFVPATSIQLLPLFQMQLGFAGFTEVIPQGLWFQYTAGLTAADYQSDWRFMRQLVLAQAAATTFAAIQTSLNMGAVEVQTVADGLSQRIKYSEKGPFAEQIAQQGMVVKSLLKQAKAKCGGFAMGQL